MAINAYSETVCRKCNGLIPIGGAMRHYAGGGHAHWDLEECIKVQKREEEFMRGVGITWKDQHVKPSNSSKKI